MAENRRSEGTLVTMQFCTAMSNIPAGTPLGILTATNQVFTLGHDPAGFSCTGNLGGHFIGIADMSISAGQAIFGVWTEGVFELTASSAWTTAYVGHPVTGDSGTVVTTVHVIGTPPIGSYIGAGTGERSGRTVLVRINPAMWRWTTLGDVGLSGTGIYQGTIFPRAL